MAHPLLTQAVEHLDIKAHNVVSLVRAMGKMAYSARDLSRAAEIYQRMLRDPECAVILTLAGSLISAGLKDVIVDLLRHNMVDAIVSTGANMIDQDFFEALGFRHWMAPEVFKSGTRDGELREAMIDRIYDTLIDEKELRVCDETCQKIFDQLAPGAYSSRRLLERFGDYLLERNVSINSIILEARKKQVPIFCPAFSDCSAGFGIVAHQHRRQTEKRPMVTFDSGADFLELTQLKVASGQTGLVMIGGGVPKNFVQDTVVSAEILGKQVPMHKYAIQITVADVRDGALSSSTLKEASSWGKVDTTWEQMVYAEATLAFPLIAGYAWHTGAWKERQAREWSKKLV